MTYKSDNAAEGQGVGLEAASLELASPCADVNQFGAVWTTEGGGKEAENEREVGI
ncbi:vacuolar iron transporter 4-like [Pyrus ussuriensis x Pyrus communis]|uniref:Vacuolar iron transporter 4-like n=1 Tax=Pyrus ussuriensis x Pyrus communis TaxID=2448454 RepID=A0A5N5G546_9ROSA|nr:vacuolar iron transporter 4-like [Pyrus ussuriensis x Pyrus communis]